jgi:hypothetical protein
MAGLVDATYKLYKPDIFGDPIAGLQQDCSNLSSRMIIHATAAEHQLVLG